MSDQLLQAVKSGDASIAKSLLENGADCNARDAEGATVLMLAAHRGDLSMAQLLVDFGADVNLEDANGWTALMKACYNADEDMGYPEVVSLLAEAGADIEKTITYGIRPLMLAAGYGEAGVVEALLQAGAEVRAKNEGDRTALMMVTEKNYIDVINLLHHAEMESGEVGSCGSKPSSAAKVVSFVKLDRH